MDPEDSKAEEIPVPPAAENIEIPEPDLLKNPDLVEEPPNTSLENPPPPIEANLHLPNDSIPSENPNGPLPSENPIDPLPTTEVPAEESVEKPGESSFLNVHISLKDLKDPLKKSSLNLDIADNLFFKDSLEKAKFSVYKQKFKANEASEMREAPEINKKTSKILNNKKQAQENKEKQKKNIKYDTYNEKLMVDTHHQRLSQVLRLTQADPLNPTVMKDSLKAREDFQSQKILNEQKRKELISKCKNAETQKNLKLHKAIVPGHKNSQSSVIVYQPVTQQVLNSRIPPPNKSLHDKIPKKRSQDSVIISEKYSQLTPYSASFKYQSGYNKNDFLSKSKPMVDYKIQVLASPN